MNIPAQPAAVTVEVCCGDIDSVAAAVAAGAPRVELCSALSEGGLTPSVGLTEAAVASGVAVNVLIRPRGGDFLYSPAEIAVMERDVAAAVAAGAHGVVIGALLADGSIDLTSCRRLIKAAAGASVTFHRAFDVCADPMQALEEIIALGCDRILTSGQAPTALEGAPMLRRLNDAARGRIAIMAGSGVSANNAARIVSLSGVGEIHASARTPLDSGMTFRRSRVSMGAPRSDEYTRMVSDSRTIASIIKAVNPTPAIK